MADEYTPTTAEIREQVAWQWDGDAETFAFAAFDRWLAAHDADLTARLAAAENLIAETLASATDALANADDSELGWDAEMSAAALHESLSAYRPVAAHPTTESETN